MPQLSSINGHTPYLRAARVYLEGKGAERPLAYDFRNVEAVDSRGLAWSEQMDETRERYGNNEPAAKGKELRSYMHYVISPDPRDSISLDALRRLACDWVDRYFGGYQAAIVYHDDNENGIPHAHVIVNNTNLADGHRLSSDLTDRRVKAQNKGLQKMALDMGLRAYAENHVSMTREEMRAQGLRVGAYERQAEPREDERSRGFGSTPRVPAPAAVPPRPRCLDHAQAGVDARAAAKGAAPSWKTEIQDLVDAARLVARDERQFIFALGRMGVEVERSAKGDYLYRHPSGGAKAVTGRRLGAAYERRNVLRGFALGYVDWAQRASSPRLAARRRVTLIVMSDPQIEALAAHVHATVPGRVPGDVSAKRLAELLAYNADHRIQAPGDYGSDPEARSMRALAERLGLFDPEAMERAERRLKSDVRLIGAWLQEERTAAGAGGSSWAEPSYAGDEPARGEGGEGRAPGSQRSRAQAPRS